MVVLAALTLIGALVGLVVVGLRYRAEQREVTRVRTLFSRYLSPPIVDELLRRKDPQLYMGRSLRATIIVCRIWNFAGFAEDLSAEETLRYLNEFFALAGTTIQKYRGMIDKFLGDGIIGVFGVPLEDAAAEEHALRAALDIVRLVDAMNTRWRAQDRRPFMVGIGINSGNVIAGDAGFSERREYTVVGPETLVAERLQEATFGLNAGIVAAAATCAPVGDLFSFVPLKAHPLPGLKRLVDACIVRGLNRESNTLTMPAAAAFTETRVDAAVVPVPAQAQRQPQPARPPPARVARISPAPPDVPSMPLIRLADPLAPLRPRATSDAGEAAFGPPPSGAAGEHADYEDGAGPPIPLPP